VFVDHVVRDLRTLSVEAIIAAPADRSHSYEINGLRVLRFATSKKVKDVAELYGAGDSLAEAEFAQILDEEKPDIVHLHAFTAAVSLKLVRAAKQRRIPVAFTYHTPTVTCQRGTLRLWGSQTCDGELKIVRCAACSLNGLGIKQNFASVVGALPPRFGRALGTLGLTGGVWTALRYSQLIEARHNAFRQMATEVDHIIAVCDWVHQILLVNGVPLAKTSVSRQGIRWEQKERTDHHAGMAVRVNSDTLRLAFVGRLDPTKGLDILIAAFRLVPTLKLKLDVYGIVQSTANAKYRDEMAVRCAADSRIAFKGPLPVNQVINRLREYDFLAIPSRWLETGPMVALEAFAAGVPVLGSKLRLKAGIQTPRRSMDVAHDMQQLYQTLLTSRNSALKRPT